MAARSLSIVWRLQPAIYFQCDHAGCERQGTTCDGSALSISCVHDQTHGENGNHNGPDPAEEIVLRFHSYFFLLAAMPSAIALRLTKQASLAFVSLSAMPTVAGVANTS